MRRSNGIANRRSLGYFELNELDQTGGPLSAHFSSMFIEDVHTHIMPLGDSSRRYPAYDVSCVDATPEAEAILRVAFMDHNGMARTIADAVSRFIMSCGQRLALWGTANYEVVEIDQHEARSAFRGYSNPNVSETGHFYLGAFPGTTIDLFGNCFQFLPQRAWRSNKRAFVSIPRQSVLRVSIPATLGGPAQHRRMIGELVRASRSPQPFGTRDGKQVIWRDYHNDSYHYNRDLQVAMETAKWGWPARWTFDKRVFDMYVAIRHVRFARSLALLRDHILASINDFLLLRGHSFRVVISGLPTAADFDGILALLTAGSLSPNDAVMKTYIH